jgi:MFS family permease
MGKQRRQHANKNNRTVDWQSARVVAILEHYSLPIVLALIVVATLRIVTTYTVFNHTSDEPSHIACGLEWLDRGVYQWEPQHPPLARVAAALGPYLLGAHSQPPPVETSRDEGMLREGLRILYRDRQYQRTLTAARAGILPFFWLACLVVYCWGRRYCGKAGAVVALFLFSFTPPILAHSGVATTDMALTAFMGASFLGGLAWIDRPTPLRAAIFGLAIAGGVLSKFSFLAFFPASVLLAGLCYYAAQRPPAAELLNAARTRIPSLLLAVALACVAIWAGYRFSAGKPEHAFMPLPAPELFQGIQDVKRHNDEGHPGYLLGQRSKTGFLLFFPVALSVKTPLAFLILLIAGAALALWRQIGVERTWLPAAFAAGILGVGLFSRINIGVRHILPIYMGLSLVAAAGVMALLAVAEQRRWLRVALAALLLWFAASSLLSHPDYLAYFNELAGSTPENILVDSDLDWGQDMNRLGERLRRASAEWVMFTPFVKADLEGEHGFPLTLRSDVPTPSPGWNAVSVTVWKADRMQLYDTHPEVTLWPDNFKPQERVGKSILLWYFPPGNARPRALEGK